MTRLKGIATTVAVALAGIAVASAAGAQTNRLTLEPGLTLTYASSSTSGEPDYEHIVVIERVDTNAVDLRSSWNRGDRRWRSFRRPLSRRERQRARAFYLFGNESDTTQYRGYAFAMTTSVILAELKRDGRSEVAVLMPEITRRTPYRGTLTRVGAGPEPFSVIVDSRRVSLPGIHVKGVLDNPLVTIKQLRMEFIFLDNPETPWFLDSRIETMDGRGGRKVLVRVGTGKVLQDLAETLRTRCQAQVNDIYFATASAEVDSASNPTFQRIATVLGANPTWQLTLVGHTDSIGSAAANLELSRRRGEAARTILIRDYRIAAARLVADGRGEREPLEDNGTLAGRARNRRVELKRKCS
jgi:outer membrane protein OmpA-like peptidoglycan-associated protein